MSTRNDNLWLGLGLATAGAMWWWYWWKRRAMQPSYFAGLGDDGDNTAEIANLENLIAEAERHSGAAGEIHPFDDSDVATLKAKLARLRSRSVQSIPATQAETQKLAKAANSQLGVQVQSLLYLSSAAFLASKPVLQSADMSHYAEAMATGKLMMKTLKKMRDYRASKGIKDTPGDLSVLDMAGYTAIIGDGYVPVLPGDPLQGLTVAELNSGNYTDEIKRANYNIYVLAAANIRQKWADAKAQISSGVQGVFGPVQSALQALGSDAMTTLSSACALAKAAGTKMAVRYYSGIAAAELQRLVIEHPMLVSSAVNTALGTVTSTVASWADNMWRETVRHAMLGPVPPELTQMTTDELKRYMATRSALAREAANAARKDADLVGKADAALGVNELLKEVQGAAGCKVTPKKEEASFGPQGAQGATGATGPTEISEFDIPDEAKTMLGIPLKATGCQKGTLVSHKDAAGKVWYYSQCQTVQGSNNPAGRWIDWGDTVQQCKDSSEPPNAQPYFHYNGVYYSLGLTPCAGMAPGTSQLAPRSRSAASRGRQRTSPLRRALKGLEF